MCKSILILIVGMLVSFSIQAQMPNPIRWTVNVKTLSADEGEMIISASIDEGWHLYGFKLPESGPKPTKIDFSKSQGIRFTGEITASKAPVSKHDNIFDMDLSYWSGRVVFKRRFRIEDAEKATVGGSIQYMGCNDETCLPPRTQTFSKKVRITNK